MPTYTGLGDEKLWISATNDNTGTSTAFNDQSGEGNDGTANGGMLVVADTSEGGTYAFDFDGTDDYIDCGTSTGIGQSSTFSVSGWFSADAFSSSAGFITAYGNVSPYIDQRGWMIRMPSSPTFLTNSAKNSSSFNSTITSSQSLSTNTWHHIVATYDVSTDAMEMFIDGVSVATGSSAGTISSPSVPFLIGKYDNNEFNGKADDIRAYDRVLTQVEITHLASARGVEGPAPVGLGDEKLWLCPSLNDSANDLSGNGNGGTYNGGMGTVADTDNGGSLAYDFDGIDDYIQTSLTDTDWRPGNGDFTICGWYKAQQKYATGRVLNDGAVYIGQESNFNRAAVEGLLPSTYTNWSNPAYPTSGFVWRHFVMTFSNGGIKTYQNGSLESEVVAGYGTTANAQSYDARIGYVNGTAWTDGYVDDIRVYNRVLTGAEITHLASARGVEGPAPVGLGDEKLWYSATLNSNGANLGSYDSTDMQLKPDTTCTIESFDSGGNDCFQSPNLTDNWKTDANFNIYAEQSDKMTLAAWISSDTLGSFSPLFGFGGDNSFKSYGLIMESTNTQKAAVSRRTASGPQITSTTNAFLSRYAVSPTHIAFVYNVTDDSIKFYKDGVLFEDVSITVLPLSNVAQNTAARFGAMVGNSSGGGTNTRFEDMRFFNRELSAGEITHLASAPNVQGPPPVGLGDEQLWFSAGLNSSGGDLSGNGNNAVISAGVTTASPPAGSTDVAWVSGSNSQNINMSSAFSDLSTANVASGKVSLSFWMLPKARTNYRVFGSQDGSDTRVRAGRTSGGVVYTQFSKSGAIVISGINGTTTTDMTHFVMVWDNNVRAAIYVNGVLQVEDLSVSSFSIGATGGAFAYPDGITDGGYIDDIRGYDRILTQAEITHLASSRGVEGTPFDGLGDEQLWLCPSLNDSPNDISGNGNDGTYQGGMGTVTSDGKLAYDFDGSNDQIDLPSSIQSALGTSEQSFSFWMNRDAVTGNGGIIGFGTNASRQMWAYGSFSHDVFYDGSSTGTPVTGTWRHIVGTIDGTNAKLYVDGVLVDTTSATQPIPTGSSTKNYIGYIDGFSRYDGKLDDIRAYDRALTQAEITHLASSRGIEGPPPVGLGGEQLWLCPSLNDSPNDISGNGNDGTYNGGMATTAATGAGGTLAYNHDTAAKSIDCGYISEITGNSCSLSIWVSNDSDDVGSRIRQWCGGWSNNAYSDMMIYQYQTNFRVVDTNSTGGTVILAEWSSSTARTWKNIVAIADVDASEYRVYEDGVLVNTFASAADMSGQAGWPFQIGGGRYDSGIGLSDDIRIYNRVLAPAEIAHLATSRGIEGPPPVGLGDEKLWLCPSLSGENTIDISGNGNATTLLGNIVYTANTAEGGSLCYEGNGASGSSGLQVPSSASTDVTRAATYSMWIQAHDLGSTEYILATRSTNQNNMFDLASTSSGVRQRINNGASTPILQSGLLTVNTWHHLALTRSSDDWELFVDGVSSATGNGALDTYIQDFTMLMQNAVGNSCWDGYLDDFRKYRRVLAPAEIAHLASARGVQGPALTGLGDEKLWLCPSLNDSADDISGNGNNGTYQGGMGTVADTSEGGTYAFDFDGTDDGISLPLASTTLRPVNITLSFWVKGDGSNNFASVLCMDDGSVNDWGVTLKDGGSSRRIGFQLSTASGNLTPVSTGLVYDLAADFGSGTTILSDQWNHICCTYDGTTAKVYFNGELRESTSVGIGGDIQYPAPLNVSVGEDVSQSAHFGGLVDDARLYDRTITQAEITHLASSRGVEGPAPVGLGDEQLWVSPTLTSDDVSDITGNGNTALYAGTVTVVEDTTGYESFQTDSTTLGTDYVYFDTPSADVSEATLAFWATSNFGASYAPIAGFCTSGFNDLRFFVSRKATDSAIRAYWKGTGSGVANLDLSMPNGNLDLTGGGFHHWALVVSNGFLSVYFDGVLLGTSPAAVTGDLDIGGTNLSLGSQDGRTTSATASKYDDIRFFDSALTQAEITHLASARGVEGPPPAGLGDEKLWLCPSLNDSADDISGNGNNGTYNGGMGTIADTGNGGSLAYNMSATTTSRIALPASFDSTIFSDNTVCGWFKYTGPLFNADNGMALIGPSSTSGQWYTAQRGNNSGDQTGSYRTYADDGSNNGDSSVAGTGNEEDNAWHHVAFVRDYTASAGTFYVDGVSIGSAAFTANELTATQDLFIGYSSLRGYAGDLSASGESLYFDDIRAYTRTLTQAEITHLATARGVEGPAPVGLGTEKTWLCPSLIDAATDVTGNKTYTYNGGLATTANTESGGTRAYDLDRTAAKAVLQATTERMDDTDSFAVSWWMKPSVLANSTNYYIADCRSATGSNFRGWGLYLRNNSGQLHLGSVIMRGTLDSSSNGITFNRQASSVVGTGMFCTVNWDNTTNTWSLYVDGVFESSYSPAVTGGPASPSGTHIAFSNYSPAPSSIYALDGMLDDLRVHNRVLTKAEIDYLATSRGVQGPAPAGLGDEKLWLCPSLSASADDISGNGNDCTMQGGDFISVDDGKDAFVFDGTTNYISVPAGIGGASETNWSLSYWYYRDSNGATHIFNLSGDGTFTNVGPISYYYGGTNSSKGLFGSRPSFVNTTLGYHATWTHVAITVDNGAAKYYKDGVETASGTTTNPCNMSLAGRIGSFASALSDMLDGSLDDLRVFTKTLTQAEITHLASSRGVEGPAPVGLGSEAAWMCPTLNRDQTGSPDELIYGVAISSETGTAVWTPDTEYGGAFRVAGAQADRVAADLIGSTTDSVGQSIWHYSLASQVAGSGIDLFKITNGTEDFAAQLGWVTSVFGGQFVGGAINITMTSIVNGGAEGIISYLKLNFNANAGWTQSLWEDYVNDAWNHWFFEFNLARGSAGAGTDYSPLATDPWWKVYLNGVACDSATVTLPNGLDIAVTEKNSFGIGTPSSWTVSGSNMHYILSSIEHDDARLFSGTMPTKAEITRMASSRGVQGPAPVGLGDEKLWLCPSLDDSPTDISGNGNNGTYVGGLATTPDTDYGGSLAYDIDVNSKGVTLPIDVIDGLTEYSMSIWVKLTVAPPASGTILGAYKPAFPDSNLSFSTFGGGLQVYGITDGGSTIGRTYENPATAGYWRHLTYTYKQGDGALVYENGVEVQNFGSQYTFTGAGGLTFSIGKGESNGTICLTDDARIYHRVLTPAEVRHLANSRGIEGPPPVGLGDEYGWWCPTLAISSDGLTNLAGGADATLKLAGQFGVVADTGSGGTEAWEGGGVVTSGINTGVVPVANSSFSMSCWFNQDAGVTGYQTIMAVEDPSTRDYLQVRTNSGVMETSFNGFEPIGTTDLRGDWHHVALTWDSTSNDAKQYIDGVLTDSGSMTNGWNQNLGEWEIGSQGRSNSNVWDGLLDDSRVYNRVLTQEEITHLATYRGIEGSPTSTGFYNPFITQAFYNFFMRQQRIR